MGSARVGTGRRGCGEPAHLINVGAVRAVAGVARRAGAAARAGSCLRADYAGEAGAGCTKRHWPHAQARVAGELHSCGPAEVRPRPEEEPFWATPRGGACSAPPTK